MSALFKITVIRNGPLPRGAEAVLRSESAAKRAQGHLPPAPHDREAARVSRVRQILEAARGR